MATALLLSLVAVACRDASLATGPQQGPDITVQPSQNTTAGRRVAFLPPLGPQPDPAFPFDNSLLNDLAVEVCTRLGDGCGATVAQFTAAGPLARRLMLAGNHYHANWDGTPGQFRIRVKLKGEAIGHIDVALGTRQTVPIRFQVSTWSVGSGVIGPAGGTLRSADGHLTLTVPAGALTAPANITIEAIPPVEAGPEFDGMDIGRAYRMGPTGTTFLVPVMIDLVSDHVPELLDDGIAAPIVALITSHNGQVEYLENTRATISETGLRLNGELRHFSPVLETSNGRATMRISGVPDIVPVQATFEVEARVTFEFGDETLISVDDVQSVIYVDQSLPPIVTAQKVVGVPPGPGQSFVARLSYGCAAAGNGTFRAGMEYVIDLRGPILVEVAGRSKEIPCIHTYPLLVTKSGDGDGSVTSNPGTINCGAGADCVDHFLASTAVTLTAVAAMGSTFLRWSGDCSGTLSVTVVHMDGVRECDAQFDLIPPETLVHELVVTVVGEGDVTSEPAGITCPTLAPDGCRRTYIHGTSVVLYAEPRPDWFFLGWSGDECVADEVDSRVAFVLMTANRACAATFLRPSPPISYLEVFVTDVHGDATTLAHVTSDEPGTNGEPIDCPPHCKVPAEDGAVMTIRVSQLTPNYAYEFTLAGETNDEDGSRRVTIDGPTHVGVTILPGYRLVVGTDGDGTGRVYSVPFGIICDHPAKGPHCARDFPTGSTVRLFASSNPGSAFAGWSNGCLPTIATDITDLVMNQSIVNCKATFYKTGGGPPTDPSFSRMPVQVTAAVESVTGPITGLGDLIRVAGRDATGRTNLVTIAQGTNVSASVMNGAPLQIIKLAYDEHTGDTFAATGQGLLNCNSELECRWRHLPNFDPNRGDRLDDVAVRDGNVAVVGIRGSEVWVYKAHALSPDFQETHVPVLEGTQARSIIALGDNHTYVGGKLLNDFQFGFAVSDNVNWSSFATGTYTPSAAVVAPNGDLISAIGGGTSSFVLRRTPEGTVEFSTEFLNTHLTSVCTRPSNSSVPLTAAFVGSFSTNATRVVTVRPDFSGGVANYMHVPGEGCVIGEGAAGLLLLKQITQTMTGERQITAIPISTAGSPFGPPTSTPLFIPHSVGLGGNDFLAVDQINPTFAVGAFGVVAQDNGAGWAGSVQATLPNGDPLTLRSVWAASATDAWAAGDGGSIFRYNGSGWSRVSNPAEANGRTIYGLAGSGPNDVYAAGEMGTLLRWNGAGWTSVNAGQAANEFLVSAWSGGPNDVYVGGVGPGTAILLHFNGTSWTRITLPPFAFDGAILGIWGSGPADVWAITQGGTLLRWNGSSWSADPMTIRQALGSGRFPNAIAGSGPNDIFIVGQGVPGMVSSVVLRYDGTGWRIVHEDLHNILMSVDVGDDGTVYVVGANGTVLVGTR